jgi:predicted Rossmann fold nucleotide-binding protein DprA/Smf involved in DNA uptake
VPGNIGHEQPGTNSLIRQGAVLVESDILGMEETRALNRRHSPDLPSLTRDEESVFRQITNEPKHIDILMKESGGTPATSGALVTWN